MNKELLQRYAELKTEQAHIEQQIEDLQPRVLEEMASVEDKQVELSGVGVFAVTHRKNWQYSEHVQEMATALRERRKEEEADGTATFEESRGLMFKRI